MMKTLSYESQDPCKKRSRAAQNKDNAPRETLNTRHQLLMQSENELGYEDFANTTRLSFASLVYPKSSMDFYINAGSESPTGNRRK